MNPETEETRSESGHRKTVAALIGVATLVAFLSIFSIWANRQALNTDNWVSTSSRILENQEVDTQLSEYVATQIFNNVDVKAELESQLPPKLRILAGPAAGGLQQLAPQATERALQTPQVQQIWKDSNRAAHLALLEIIDGGGNNVSTKNGEVVLNLNEILSSVSAQIGVGQKLVAQIPPGAGQITVLKSADISTAQKVAKLIRTLPVVLTIIMLILYGLAIYLAGPRRREALRAVGLSLLAAGILTLLARGLAGTYVVDALTKTDQAKPAADAVWSIGTSLLVTIATSAIAFGILLFLGAWLAGPTRLAKAARRESAPYVQEHPIAFIGAVAIIFIALTILAPIAAFGTWPGVLIFAALFTVGVALLRHQALREFPGTNS